MYNSLPNAGSVVKVVCRNPNPYYHDLAEFTDTEYEGSVLPVNKWDLPNTFNLTTDMKEFPVRNISLNCVMNIEYLSGEGRDITPDDFKTEEFKVTGSKGDIYTVTRVGQTYKCTCVAFQWKKHCKHIESVKK